MSKREQHKPKINLLKVLVTEISKENFIVKCSIRKTSKVMGSRDRQSRRGNRGKKERKERR